MAREDLNVLVEIVWIITRRGPFHQPCGHLGKGPGARGVQLAGIIQHLDGVRLNGILVSEGPYCHAGVILVHAYGPFGAGEQFLQIVFTGQEVAAAAPERHLVHHIEAHFVAEFIEVGAEGIMRRADGVHSGALHQFHLPAPFPVTYRTALDRVYLIPGHSFQKGPAPVDVHAFAGEYHVAEAHFLHHPLYLFALLVDERHHQVVEVGVFVAPKVLPFRHLYAVVVHQRHLRHGIAVNLDVACIMASLGAESDVFDPGVLIHREYLHVAEDAHERPAVVGVEKPCRRTRRNLHLYLVEAIPSQKIGYFILRREIGASRVVASDFPAVQAYFVSEQYAAHAEHHLPAVPA